MKLKKSSYWNWRHKIEEMQHADTKLKLVRLTASLMEKEIETMRLKTQIYNQTIKTHEESCAARKKEYGDIKLQLENEIGHSLNNCTIDDVTLEVIKHENDDLKS